MYDRLAEVNASDLEIDSGSTSKIHNSNRMKSYQGLLTNRLAKDSCMAYLQCACTEHGSDATSQCMDEK